ncbi:MAG: DNA repair protein RadC [Oscillospiraceae bacterium]|nr:DNA repair protein RadC [Oscillospiraceae bacterium]
MSDPDGIRNIHSGHRARQKKLLMENGLDSFADHGVIEILLYYALPRKDTNELAHALINRFGSLSGVFDAPIGELMKVSGIGENAALLLKLVPQLAARYVRSRAEHGVVCDSAGELAEYLFPCFIGERDEVVYMLTLDSKRKVLGCHLLFRGTVNVTPVALRKITERALADNAVSIVLAHNHVGGVAVPSGDDVSSTRMIRDTLSALEIELLDHLVFGAGDYVSMREDGLI